MLRHPLPTSRLFTSKKNKSSHVPLSDEKLCKFRDCLSDLKLIIIDEISLVNPDLLYQTHERLGEIWPDKKKLPFAGISVIAVGDLLQVNIQILYYQNNSRA